MNVHTIELTNPKVLIRPNNAESAKEKNVIIRDERPEKKALQNKTPQVAAKASMLRGQGKKKKADSKSADLTGSRSGLTGVPTGLTGTQTGLIMRPISLGIPPEPRTRQGRVLRSS